MGDRDQLGLDLDVVVPAGTAAYMAPEQADAPRFVTARPGPKKFGKREKTRRMFTVDVEHGLGIVLMPRRGCVVTTIDKEGNILRDRERHPDKRLYVNRGDRLMVWGNAANDEIALVEVITIVPTKTSERLRVITIAGELTRATTTAFVVKAGAAA